MHDDLAENVLGLFLQSWALTGL